jgi:tRNA pseudouridine38-40 synthase
MSLTSKPLNAIMDEQKNIRLILEYDGTRYHGWQRQKTDLTVQGVLEDSIRTMVGEPVVLIGSGRTDAGVHALNQVCNFITRSQIEPDSMRRGLNSLIPDDIFIKKIEYVPLDFHSRYSVRSKTYEYRIWNRKEANVFLRDYSWHIRGNLDIDIMKAGLSILIGRHDFSSFKSRGSTNKDPVRHILLAELHGPSEGILVLLFEADGFLRHMVRNITGTLVDLGKRKLSVEGFRKTLLSRQRNEVGIKAPPQGLFLKDVRY